MQITLCAIHTYASANNMQCYPHLCMCALFASTI